VPALTWGVATFMQDSAFFLYLMAAMNKMEATMLNGAANVQ
jgi:hypothetical protein